MWPHQVTQKVKQTVRLCLQCICSLGGGGGLREANWSAHDRRRVAAANTIGTSHVCFLKPTPHLDLQTSDRFDKSKQVYYCLEWLWLDRLRASEEKKTWDLSQEVDYCLEWLCLCAVCLLGYGLRIISCETCLHFETKVTTKGWHVAAKPGLCPFLQSFLAVFVLIYILKWPFGFLF